MDFLYDLYQNQKIHSAEHAAGRAESKVDTVKDELLMLHRKIDRLCLLSQAMWEIIRDNTAIDDSLILEKAKEIDERDGAANNRMGGSTEPCPSCKRPLSPKHNKCLYCGHIVEKKHVFHT